MESDIAGIVPPQSAPARAPHEPLVFFVQLREQRVNPALRLPQLDLTASLDGGILRADPHPGARPRTSVQLANSLRHIPQLAGRLLQPLRSPRLLFSRGGHHCRSLTQLLLAHGQLLLSDTGSLLSSPCVHLSGHPPQVVPRHRPEQGHDVQHDVLLPVVRLDVLAAGGQECLPNDPCREGEDYGADEDGHPLAEHLQEIG